MKNTLSFPIIIASVILAFTGCKDDDETPTPSVSSNGEVLIDITNIIEDSIGLRNVDETGATTYYNSFGEPYTVTKLKYYISNVQLMRADTVAYTMPESYFLINESIDSTKKLLIPGVPAGNYDGVRFVMGVDSTRNVSGAQAGALTPSDMFWTWNSGYIFFKLEGESPLAPDSTGNFMVYHIAGFRESDNTNALRSVEIGFDGRELVVSGSREAEIHLFANINKLFDAVHPIRIANVSSMMTAGGVSLQFADNYSNMFIFDHLHY